MVRIKEFSSDYFLENDLTLLSFYYHDGADLDIILLDKNNKEIQFIFEWAKSICLIDNKDILDEYKNITTGCYQLEESKYLDWYHQSTNDRFKDWKVTHYLLVTLNITISIISWGDEKIKLTLLN